MPQSHKHQLPQHPTYQIGLKQPDPITIQDRFIPITPIQTTIFNNLIQGYAFADYLTEGFQYGFRLGYEGPRVPLHSINLPSANQNPSITTSKLNKEVNLGRVKGPFNNPPFENFRISPIGCVPKKAPGDFRLIHHLSHPNGASLNDFICAELATVQYSNFDDACNLLYNLGPNTLMAKTDIDSAFRLIPIHPDDHELLGITWMDRYYFDTCLPFGASSSCAIFERFSTGLQWMAANWYNITNSLHILEIKLN